jgi:hypothetical protein
VDGFDVVGIGPPDFVLVRDGMEQLTAWNNSGNRFEQKAVTRGSEGAATGGVSVDIDGSSNQVWMKWKVALR